MVARSNTTGTQTYGDDVTLGVDTTISASTARFSGKVTGSTNSLTITGNAVLGDGSGDDTLSPPACRSAAQPISTRRPSPPVATRLTPAR